MRFESNGIFFVFIVPANRGSFIALSFTLSRWARDLYTIHEKTTVSHVLVSPRLVHLADFDFSAIAERRALDPLDRFVFRLHLPDPEARDQIFRFGERPIGHRMLAARELDARTL